MQIKIDLWEHRATLRNVIATFGDEVDRAFLLEVLWRDARENPAFAQDLLTLRSAISEMDEKQVAEALKPYH